MNYCDWLSNNQEKFNNCEGVWINKFPVPLYNLKKMTSALSQVSGIQTLTRTYIQTKDRN